MLVRHTNSGPPSSAIYISGPGFSSGALCAGGYGFIRNRRNRRGGGRGGGTSVLSPMPICLPTVAAKSGSAMRSATDAAIRSSNQPWFPHQIYDDLIIRATVGIPALIAPSVADRQADRQAGRQPARQPER